MAGDWIKVQIDLPDKPKVIAIASRLSLDVDTVVGKLIRLWGWANRHTLDGNVPGVTSALLDHRAGVTGFAAAMEAVGWLSVTPDGIAFGHFDEHNSKTAKTRALTAIRVSEKKRRTNANGNGKVTGDALPREEKRREEQESKSHSRKRVTDPRAQHPAIKAVRKVRERYPPKELWDEMILLLGDEPLEELLAHCFKEWVRLGFSRENYNWVFDWYPNGGPTEKYARQSASDENFRRRVESEALLAKP